MARVRRQGRTSGKAGGRSQAGDAALYSNLADGSSQMLGLEELHPHPDNREICGELAEAKKEALREDLLLAGVREPLHVWWHDSQWVVVSGNERLEVISTRMTPSDRRGANGGEGLEYLPCIVKVFETTAEARVHLERANQNRKVIKSRPPGVRVQQFFPVAEFPLLYASVAGNFAGDTQISEVDLPGGKTTSLAEPRPAAELQAEKKRLVAYVSSVTGYTESTVRKVLSGIAREAKAPAQNKKAAAKKFSPRLQSLKKDEMFFALLQSLKKDEMFFALESFVKREKRVGLRALRRQLDRLEKDLK